VSCAFNGFCEQALMSRADPADSPGQYFPALRNKVTEELSVFEINVSYFFRAKLADSFAPNAETSWNWHSFRLSSLGFQSRVQGSQLKACNPEPGTLNRER
jgi:hypothetical protein